MAELVETIPAVVLAVYAHPDDPEVACGGALARWAAAGADVHLLIVCAGEKGTTDPCAVAAEVAARRADEVAAAAAILGLAGHEVLGHPDGAVENDSAFQAALVGRIRRLRPDVVVCPDPTAAYFGRTYINHRDHRVVGWAVLDAVAPAAWMPLYYPEQGPAHHVTSVYLSGTLEPDIFVDISAVLGAKTAALACHKSQLADSGEDLATAIRHRAEEVGRAVGVGHAEGFRLLTPS
ncbi:MAG: PIG-L deacetylase family protein [Acidimicrobiales bacterium]